MRKEKRCFLKWRMVDTLYLSTWTRSLEDYARCCSTTVLKCGCSSVGAQVWVLKTYMDMDAHACMHKIRRHPNACVRAIHNAPAPPSCYSPVSRPSCLIFHHPDLLHSHVHFCPRVVRAGLQLEGGGAVESTEPNDAATD